MQTGMGRTPLTQFTFLNPRESASSADSSGVAGGRLGDAVPFLRIKGMGVNSTRISKFDSRPHFLSD